MESGLYYSNKLNLLIEFYFYDNTYHHYTVSRYDFFNGGTITYSDPYFKRSFLNDLVYIGKVI